MNRFVSEPTAVFPDPAALHDGEIHLWRVLLDEWSAEAALLAGLLCDDEVRRAERLRGEELRRRFVVRRALLRRVLSRYTGIEPQTLAFGAGPFGKPFVASQGEGGDLQFGVSNSRGVAVFTVARGRVVGVDVECQDARPLDRSHARVFLSERELAAWERIDAADQPQALLRLWTVKEACLKAAGFGLSVDPRCVETPADCLLSDGQVRIRPPQGVPLDLTVVCFEPVAGYAAAVAYSGSECRIRTIPCRPRRDY